MSTTPTTTQRNLAARMGRWSAGHWKTATFGWLAFVVVAFGLGGAVGTKTIDPNTAGPGRVRPDGPDPRRRVQAARRRERPGPEHVARRRAIRRSGPRSRTSSRGISGARRRPERPLAARPRQRGPDREGRARRARRVRDPRRRRQGGRQDRPGPRPGRRGAAGPSRSSSSASSATRARSTRVDDGLREDLEKAGLLLAPDHAGHPRDRVRRARGRGHPAAARADRRLRDVRPARAAQPGAADGAGGVRRSCS